MSGIVLALGSRPVGRAAFTNEQAWALSTATWALLHDHLRERLPEPPERAVLDALEDVIELDEDAVADGTIAWVFQEHWALGAICGLHWATVALAERWDDVKALFLRHGRRLVGRRPGRDALSAGPPIGRLGDTVVAADTDGTPIADVPADDELRAFAAALADGGCRCPLCGGRRRAPRRAAFEPPVWLQACDAAEQGALETLDALLASGEYVDPERVMVSATACPDAVRHLLAKGHPPVASAVYQAAARNATDALRLLLDAGGDPNAGEAVTGESARRVAVRTGAAEAVALLLAAGADPEG